MAAEFDPLDDFCWMKDGPIPLVDPADLKSVWSMLEELKKDFEKLVPNRASNQYFSVGIDYVKQVCSPGANAGAVWYRLAKLEMLKMRSEATGTSLPWLQEGKPGDAVFKALATLPMTGLPPGVVRESPLFDVEELIRLIQKEPQA